MTDKQVIIDCKYKFQNNEKFDGKPYCTCFNELCDISIICDHNCQIYEDYKQLARKTQKCEKLTNKNNLLTAELNQIKLLLEGKNTQYNVKVEECEELKEKNKVLQKLVSELEYSVQVGIELDDRYFKALDEIEKVINNILNSCLGRNTVGCRPAHNVCGDLIKILDTINKAKGGNNENT